MHNEHGPVIQEFGITTWLLQNKLNFFVESFFDSSFEIFRALNGKHEFFFLLSLL